MDIFIKMFVFSPSYDIMTKNRYENGEIMKLRRSERMVVISNYLINNPYKLTSLNTFAEKYEAAKSSISEDIAIIKKLLKNQESAKLKQLQGRAEVSFLHQESLMKKLKQSSKNYVTAFQKAIVFFLEVISTYQIY